MTERRRLSAIKFDVQDPATLAGYYTRYLGMNAVETHDGVRVGYVGQSADLLLCENERAGPYIHSHEDRYWKIGITVPNLDLACDQLRGRGIEVSAPRQFEDIGYLAHLTDPCGFQIELLQHTFDGQVRTSDGDAALPLGGGASVGQVTYRTADIGAELVEYRDRLGMRLLSWQPVEAYGFELYFLAFTDEVPPDPDIASVANRPWLWQRPYTTLEFQCFPDGNKDRFVDSDHAMGEMVFE